MTKQDYVLQVWAGILGLLKLRQEYSNSRTSLADICYSDLQMKAMKKRLPLDLTGVTDLRSFAEGWLTYERPRAERIAEASLYNLQTNYQTAFEEWRPSPSASSIWVSNLGRVWSLKRVNGLLKPQVKDPRKNKHRLYIGVYDDLGYRRLSVSRLVAEAFCPNPEGKEFVDHINEITTDNRACNLRWCTREENLAWYAGNHYGGGPIPPPNLFGDAD